MPPTPSKEHPPISPSSESQPANDHESDLEQDLPLTLLEIRNLSSVGAKHFLRSTDASAILTESIRTVLHLLNPHQELHPNVRSITLVLRDFDGVAYTTGKDIDFEHKEIHFSTAYIESIAPERIKEEIAGVLVHEMVHVWQWNGKHRCNGGLIEGIADWVRLHAGLDPPHWRQRSKECEWDSGYEVTGYFLDWMEERVGKGLVVKINQRLKEEYVEEEFWTEFCNGEDIKALWAKYAESLDEDSGDEEPQGEEPREVDEIESSEDKKGDIPNGVV
ncbi:MAG: hypothetical protein Q9214_000716 [Letrouitia sp. 1 TL-2023]